MSGLSAFVAPSQPTIAGMPNSRAMIAACEVRPPLSVTISDASFIIGSQSGVVISVTSTSPGSNTRSSTGMSSRFRPSASIVRSARFLRMTSSYER